MKKVLVSLAIIVIVIVGLFALSRYVPFLDPQSYSTHPINGYNGVAAEWSKVESNYGTTMKATIAPTTVDFMPTPEALLNPFGYPTGLHAEVSQPYQSSTRTDYVNTVAVPNDLTQTNKTRTWEVHIVKMRFYVYIYTRDGSALPVKNVKFYLHLSENQFAVFPSANTSKAFVIEAQTYAPTEETDSNLVRVSPNGQGIDFPPVNSQPATLPSWISDSGYQSSLGQYFESFDIVFSVESMEPSSILFQPYL